jgi:hypothetical protein
MSIVLFLIISAYISPSLLSAQSKTEVLDPSSHTTYSVNALPVADLTISKYLLIPVPCFHDICPRRSSIF